MHSPPTPPSPLRAALDQAFFFLVILALSFFAMLVCGGGRVPFRWYLLFVLGCLPLFGVSAFFAAQLGRRAPPPVERRDRWKLREIRPETGPKHTPRRAA